MWCYKTNNDGRLLRHGDKIKIAKQFACRDITGPNNNNKGRESRQGDKIPKEVETIIGQSRHLISYVRPNAEMVFVLDEEQFLELSAIKGTFIAAVEC